MATAHRGAVGDGIGCLRREPHWSSIGHFRPLSLAPFTLLADGRVLVTGGYFGCIGSNPCADGEVADTWLFDPAGDA